MQASLGFLKGPPSRMSAPSRFHKTGTCGSHASVPVLARHPCFNRQRDFTLRPG